MLLGIDDHRPVVGDHRRLGDFTPMLASAFKPASVILLDLEHAESIKRRSPAASTSVCRPSGPLT